MVILAIALIALALSLTWRFISGIIGLKSLKDGVLTIPEVKLSKRMIILSLVEHIVFFITTLSSLIIVIRCLKH